jgi:hypothetical protein
MAKSKAERQVTAESLLTRVEVMMRDGIASMSKEEFQKYRAASKKTIASIREKAGDCAESSETRSQATRVLHV